MTEYNISISRGLRNKYMSDIENDFDEKDSECEDNEGEFSDEFSEEETGEEDKNSKSINLSPIMTIVEEGTKSDTDAFICRNIQHVEWLNDNFKQLQQEQLSKILNKQGKGIYVIHKFNKENKYKYNWTSLEDFKKKRIPEKHGNQIIGMVEWAKPQSLILFFVDMDRTMSLYHID